MRVFVASQAFSVPRQIDAVDQHAEDVIVGEPCGGEFSRGSGGISWVYKRSSGRVQMRLRWRRQYCERGYRFILIMFQVCTRSFSFLSGIVTHGAGLLG